jgi:hypothetical protein
MIAGALLLVFLFIHLEKALHSHPADSHVTHQNELSINSITPNCPICDFQVAQNTILPSVVLTDVPISFILREYGVTPVLYYYHSPASVSNRGPPAC